MTKLFDAAQLDALAKALGDTEVGLTGSEIGYQLARCKMVDPGPITKWKRIFNAFVVHGGDKPGHWIVGDVPMRAV